MALPGALPDAIKDGFKNDDYVAPDEYRKFVILTNVSF
jgi:hypothetical protein